MKYSIFIYISAVGLYIIFGVILFLAIIFYLLFSYYWDKVNESSILIRNLYLLNKNYKFQTGIKKHFKLIKACTSYAQYKKVDLSNLFMSIINENIEYYDELLNKIDSNKMLQKEYTEELNKLQSEATKELAHKYKMPLFVYRMIEKEIVNRKKANPRIDTEFIVRTTYMSPKGKNAYQNAFTYNVSNAKKYIELVHLQIDKKKTKEYQRAIMSDALRYEILHRDSFKCQLCGASSKDGYTKLHVDHIIPIAKGGKTEKSNLRTLCDRCNLGKRDSIE